VSWISNIEEGGEELLHKKRDLMNKEKEPGGNSEKFRPQRSIFQKENWNIQGERLFSTGESSSVGGISKGEGSLPPREEAVRKRE